MTRKRASEFDLMSIGNGWCVEVHDGESPSSQHFGSGYGWRINSFSHCKQASEAQPLKHVLVRGHVK